MRRLTAAFRRLLFAACLLAGGTPASAIPPLPLHEIAPNQALGTQAAYLKESSTPLTLAKAAAERAAGRFTASDAPILAFGIGSAPVWIHLGIANPGPEAQLRRLLIENTWQDRIDIHFVGPDGQSESHRVGDTRPFAERPVASRFFAADHRFAPGTTDIYLRVESADPIVLPLFLGPPQAIAEREQKQGYRYGFLYGYLLALLAYNLLLFVALRDKRQLSYAGYIAMFVLANVAYTGHGFAHLWGEHVALQRWVIPTLMMAFSASGLVFARYFLDTPEHFPRAHKAMLWSGSGFLAAYALSLVVSDNQAGAILIAFVATNLFSLAMPVLGVAAVVAGHRFSRYFLFATLASAIGAAVTALSVLGLIAYSDLRYRAVEIGMLIDATLLALALGSQFRSLKAERALAQRLAARDPLTDLYNRRSFLEQARPLWSAARRHARELSLIMVDIDRFKSINDTHGHAAGDDAIVAVAQALNASVRAEDIVARWGGEEFLVLLPDTPLDAAVALAERLRRTIEDTRLPMADGELRFTVSLGVANSEGKESLDRLITAADHFLYQSKHRGRNQVSSELAGATA
ncbi:MAG: GGDEF domain-containing protein [Rhodocyclales bacterium]|nr:GGDEF domain-containing protein [Rhodocyclales bacterium]